MTSLRKIIVNATSEMLDEPDEHGIYKTSRFYDRLEREVSEYFGQPQIIESPCLELLLETVKNSAVMTQELQNAVAQYVTVQSQPIRLIRRKDS